jgi:altronate hydrolase
VSCANSVAHFIASRVSDEDLSNYPHVDGVISLGHSSGCGMSPNDDSMLYLRRVISGYARHPNFAGVILVGLGCEKNQIVDICRNMNLESGSFLQAMNIQDIGGTTKAVDWGASMLREMLPTANKISRQILPASHLVLGLECGASDSFSGISANPALGAAADLLVRNGGTVLLSETPEVYGAEHLLTRRSTNRIVAEKLLELIEWWKEYTALHGTTLNNNPTPGNLKGGLTNILEKSLGAVAKGGTTNLNQVYHYGEKIIDKGLVFMDTPGYDIISITGMVAGGVNIICFTTGQGSVIGTKPVPCLKIASNQTMYSHLPEDMDINCGPVIAGKASITDMGEIIFNSILDTASGKKTKSEAHGFGGFEFIPWQRGVIT